MVKAEIISRETAGLDVSLYSLSDCASLRRQRGKFQKYIWLKTGILQKRKLLKNIGKSKWAVFGEYNFSEEKKEAIFMAKVLAVLSSGYKDEKNDYHTGWWSEELFAPMLLLEEAGHEVELASPLGGKPEIDQVSISEQYDPTGKYKELYESGRADETRKLADVSAEDYDVLLIVGGHGAMYDLAKNEDLHKLMNSVHDGGGIVAAECHGPAPLAFAKREDGESFIAGKKVTGYPDAMEPEGLLDILPFSLEQEMSKVANYDRGDLEKTGHAVWADEQLVTSRDPFSSELMGEELVKALAKRNKR
jgi:putative intracellular protease/amidase